MCSSDLHRTSSNPPASQVLVYHLTRICSLSRGHEAPWLLRESEFPRLRPLLELESTVASSVQTLIDDGPSMPCAEAALVFSQCAISPPVTTDLLV